MRVRVCAIFGTWPDPTKLCSCQMGESLNITYCQNEKLAVGPTLFCVWAIHSVCVCVCSLFMSLARRFYYYTQVILWFSVHFNCAWAKPYIHSGNASPLVAGELVNMFRKHAQLYMYETYKCNDLVFRKCIDHIFISTHTAFHAMQIHFNSFRSVQFSVAQHFALNIIWHNNNYAIDRHLALRSIVCALCICFCMYCRNELNEWLVYATLKLVTSLYFNCNRII